VTAPGTPHRFELGERYRASQASLRGTIVVRTAEPYGFGARFTTTSPCCRAVSRIDAVDASWGDTGTFVTCSGCGWKWTVHLALDGTRLPRIPGDAAHPHIKANQAEWVSRGFGTRRRQR
jgi:hypothetical protein